MTRVILVVDDEPAIVTTVCLILESQGFSPVGANSGLEAISKAEEHCPDLLFSDIMMPGLNGFEAALQIKKRCPDCRLLFFSGFAEVSALAAALKKSGHDFELLTKPVPPASLVEKVKAALADKGDQASAGK